MIKKLVFGLIGVWVVVFLIGSTSNHKAAALSSPRELHGCAAVEDMRHWDEIEDRPAWNAYWLMLVATGTCQTVYKGTNLTIVGGELFDYSHVKLDNGDELWVHTKMLKD